MVRRISGIFLTLLLLAVFVGAAGAEFARWQVQEGLAHFLGVPVRVKRLTFGSHRLTLHGVSFLVPAQAPVRVDRLNLEGSILSLATGRLFTGPFPNLRSIKLTGLTLSVAGVPLRAGGEVFLRGQPGAYAQVDGLLTLEHPMVKGEIEITGQLLEPVLYGWIESAPTGRVHFISQLDISREAIGLPRMQIQGGWNATGGLVFRQPSWKGELTVVGPDEQRFGFQVMPGEKGFTRAVFWIRPEGVPQKELAVEWIVRLGQLNFKADLMRSQALLRGQTDLIFPYRTAVRLDLAGLELDEIADWIPNQSSSKVDGALRGNVEVNGFLGQISSKGTLIADRGRFGRLSFDQIAIRFQGKGPYLRLEDSQLSRRGSAMQMEGSLDVRRLGQHDFFRNVKLKPVPGFERSLELGPLAVGATDQEGGVNFQTAITSDQNVKIKVENEERVIAVEHRKKF